MSAVSIKQKAWKVQQGMTTEEIGQLLGKPDFRRFDGSLEQWEYQSGGIATSCKFLIIEFRNRKVTGMDSYNEIAKETSVGDLYSSKISLDTVGSIDDNEFEKIYNETKNSVFKDSTLEKAIINKKLSCAQCLKLMSLYTFDNDKLKMLQVLKDHIADTTNYDNIVNSLDFISSKNKAKEILGIP